MAEPEAVSPPPPPPEPTSSSSNQEMEGGELAGAGDNPAGASPSQAAPPMVQPTPSTTPQRPRRNSKVKPPECCDKCCTGVMKVFAHDAIYGSFVGPHPVSFLCCCIPCKSCINRDFVRPFAHASIATKTMYFLMLAAVTFLSCFFIIPWPETAFSLKSTSIASFYPCQGKLIKNWEKNGGCREHAGYFMVYRVFLSFAIVMLTNSLIVMYVSSTKEDAQRAKIHQGFWCYKYLYLTGLMFLFFLFPGGGTDPDGLFEVTISLMGNVAHFIFSFVELTYILDLVELWVVDNRTNGGSWANCIYWIFTGIIGLMAFLMFLWVCGNFSYVRAFHPNESYWPYDNCKAGTFDSLNLTHSTMIVLTLSVIALIILVMCFKRKFRKRFPYTGWIQVAVLSLYNVSYLWSSLYSSPDIHSRPRCNWALQRIAADGTNVTHPHAGLQAGSVDVYFRISGFLHGIVTILALLYFAFVHGPRTKTAPFSAIYDAMFTPKSRIPVFPDEEDASPEFNKALDKFQVWDDEKVDVGYSWTRFYWFMLLGSLSLMMAMTNFTNPWAPDRYNSSYLAFGSKYLSATVATAAYLIILLCPCGRIFPEWQTIPKRRKKKIVLIKKRLSTGEEIPPNEEVPLDDIIEEMKEVEDDDSQEIIEAPISSTHHRPKNCGCLM